MEKQTRLRRSERIDLDISKPRKPMAKSSSSKDNLAEEPPADILKCKMLDHASNPRSERWARKLAGDMWEPHDTFDFTTGDLLTLSISLAFSAYV